MITFNHQPLFATGAHVLKPDPLEACVVEHPSIHPSPHTVTRQGTHPRTLTQLGSLLADTRQDLLDQTHAIEQAVNTPPAVLDDGLGQTFPNTLLIRAEFHPIQHIGPRFRRRYRLTYQHLSP